MGPKKITKKSPRGQPQQQPPRRGEPPQQLLPPPEVRIRYIDDKVVHVNEDEFKEVVQKLTGKSPTSSPPRVDDPEEWPNFDFDFDFDNTSPLRGILSPGPDNMPPISPDFFDFAPITDSQGPKPGVYDDDGRTMTNDQINEHAIYNNTVPDFDELYKLVAPSPPMADGYWNQQRHNQPPMSRGGPPKRHRSDFEGPPSSGHDMHGYFPRDEDRGIPRSVKDTRTIDSAYDRYLQSMQTPSMPPEGVDPFNGVGMGRPGGNNMMHRPSMDDLMTGRGGILPPPDFGPNGRGMGFAQEDLVGRPSRQTLPLPPDASSTLYVEGLPPNCSRREVAHIFRPFVGYREVRLVTKDSKQRNGDPIVLCFVDFDKPESAATVLTALQSYRMDENDPDSKILRLQFSRNPGPRQGQRGGRR